MFKSFTIGLGLILSPFLMKAQFKMLTPLNEIKSHSLIKFEYQDTSKDISANFATFTDQSIDLEEIEMTRSGNKWTGSYIIPDTVKAFDILIQVGDSIMDNKGEGYVYSITPKNSKDYSPILEKARFYNRKRGDASYYLHIKDNKEKSLSIYRRYFKLDPSLKTMYVPDYLAALFAFEPKSPEFKLLFDKTFNKEKTSGAPEQKLIKLALILLSSQDGNDSKEYKKKYDSLYTVIEKARPQGHYAAWAYVDKLSRSNNADSLETIFPDIRKKFPGANFFLYPLNDKYTTIISKIVRKYPHNYHKIIEYYMQMTEFKGQTLFMALLADDLSHFKESLNAADSVILFSIEKADTIINDERYRPKYLTRKDWQDYIRVQYLSNYYATYANILYLQSKYKDALTAQEKYYDLSNHIFDDAGANTNYIKILNANAEYDSVLSKGAFFIKVNAGSKEMVDNMAIAYKKIHPDADTATYSKNLILQMNDIKYSKVKELMVDLPSHNFTLKDLNGNIVTLDSLKGKIVVLDFWATWCGPCKKSFPGMQRAIYKNMNDKGVVFLFIDTWEEDADTAKRCQSIKDFVKSNYFTFRVLLDEKNVDSGKYKVVTDYNVSEIPTKFVLDKTGRIRFKTTGAPSTDEEVSDEVCTMIDMLKEN